MTILDRYMKLKQEVERSCTVAKRDPKTVKIVIASKGLSLQEVQILKDFGHRSFGENRLQDALEKVKQFPELDWHFIGHLQTNKAKLVVQNFSLIQTVDSLRLLDELNSLGESFKRKIPILLQVNLTEKESQYGFLRSDIEKAVEIAFNSTYLNVRGLMMIGSIDPKKNQEIYFKEFKGLFDQLRKRYPEENFKELSMGMSLDFHEAILLGATIIRVGRFLKI